MGSSSKTTHDDFGQRMRASRWGAMLALLTILFGFGLGGLFGALEGVLKGELEARAEAVRDTVYAGDAEKQKSVVDKSWSYYQRAHLHGGAIGVVSLCSILLLASLRRPKNGLRSLIAWALGIGGLGYASFWLLAARSAVQLGSAGLAKDSLEWLAVPSAGLLLSGMGGVAALALLEWFTPPREGAA